MADREREFAIEGMHCAACSARIERVVGALPGVRSVTVSLAANEARVELLPDAPERETTAAVCQAVADAGFRAEPLRDFAGGAAELSDAARRWEERSARQQAELEERRRDLRPAFCFALPLLVLSMGEMFGMPLPGLIDPRVSPGGFALAQLLLCLPVLWSGRRFFLLGLPALVRRSPTMDTLVALGTGAAFLYSLWNTLQLFPGGGSAPLMSHSPAAVPGAEGAQGAGDVWDMLFGAGHSLHGVELYYESAAVVIALVSLGKYLESRSRFGASLAIKALLDLAPEMALRLKPDGEVSGGTGDARDSGSGPGAKPDAAAGADISGAEDGTEEVRVADLVPGDRLLVRPGGRVPVDGTVLSGSSHVDESLLTGESMPVAKAPGDALTGGSINGAGALVMRAEKVGADTALARIVNLVQQAQGSKAPIAGLADRVSLYFVPVVMAIATLAGLFWWQADSAAFGLRIFVSVMVIACPCAMGLATPMSIMVGTGRGAALGVLFKNGEALERASKVTAMVFDKTGTLTRGRPELRGAFDPETGEPLAPERENDCLRLAASLEASSEHPLGRALVEAARGRGLALLSTEAFSAVPGLGIRGILEINGRRSAAVVGSAAFAAREMDAERGGEPAGPEGSRLAALAERLAAVGQTPVALLLDGRAAAVFAVADALRPESPEVVRALADMGIASVMITGDNAATAKAIAKEAGLERVIAGVLPEGKAEAVAGLQAQGLVVGMTGDGVNDAPALARADVGFAVHGGIDVAVETGDVALMRGDLRLVVTALGLGRATMRNIRENLFWAFAYNAVGIPLAAGVAWYFGGPALSPMLAGAAMAFSSVSVVTNALRLRFWKR